MSATTRTETKHSSSMVESNEWNNMKNESSTSANRSNTRSICGTRSSVLCRTAAVACSQPLASEIGLHILRSNVNANAADAAIAVAAALCVLEPCSTGLGGDMFCLWYNGTNQEVSCINGSGRSPASLTYERVVEQYQSSRNQNSSTTKRNCHQQNSNSCVECISSGTSSGTSSISTTTTTAISTGDDTNDIDNLPRQSQEQSQQQSQGQLREPQQQQPQQALLEEFLLHESALAVTVPGAAMGWQDLYNRHGSGSLSFAELLEPAALLAEKGFPVGPVTAHFWQEGFSTIQRWYDGINDEDDDDDNHSNTDRDAVRTTTTTTTTTNTTKRRYPLTTSKNLPPQAGDIVTNPDMAAVLRELGAKGAYDGFYTSWIGQAIVDAVQKHGGCLTMQDLCTHRTSTFPDPLSFQYRNVRLWQAPPNGQGIAGLIALAGIQHLEQQTQPLSPDTAGTALQYHVMIEMMRLGFADARAHVADLDHMDVDCNTFLLDQHRIATRAQALFNPNKATIHGIPDATSCTVSFQVVDRAGNAISFVNSNYLGFGTGIVPSGCGFPLQSRGAGFTVVPSSLSPPHPNAIGPSKRPYHTIIPGIITHADTNELYATISNMGGYMQPQGHVQLLLNMIACEMDPQTAIDFPRFCIADGTQNGIVHLETGVDEHVLHDLVVNKGHQIKTNVCGYDRAVFGRAQIIQRNRDTGVLWAGSDGRADGCAMGF